jgi:amidase
MVAYAKHAVAVDHIHNCISELFIEKALERAALLDEYYQQTGMLIGPLHGLPIVFSDECILQGAGIQM